VDAGVITYHSFESSYGRFILGAFSKGACYIGLPGMELPLVKKWCLQNFPSKRLFESPELTFLPMQQINEYLSGSRWEFDFQIDHVHRAFRSRVLAEIAKRPYGETSSYDKIAQQIGKPFASRAAGTANVTNPLPIVIPR